MIKEILEQEGLYCGEVWLEEDNLYGIIINDIEFYHINEDKDKAIEWACIEYVKENGFYLDWLTTYLKNTERCFYMEFLEEQNGVKKYTIKNGEEHIYLYIKKNKISALSILMTYGNFHDKLIAWLYANDIEVVE